MSDELQLSRQLIDSVQQVVIQHDERAKDPFIGSQYLAAVIGFLVGNSNLPSNDKKDIVNELASFMNHVYQDIAKQQATPVAPPGSAFGIWKPGKS